MIWVPVTVFTDAETPQPRQEATFDDYIPSTTASRQAVHKPIDVETDLAFVQSSEVSIDY